MRISDWSSDVCSSDLIAPWRVGGELRWERGPLRASLGAVRYAEQDRVAEFEHATPGYTLVDAHLAWHADTARGNAWEIFLDGSNLLDEAARVHTSFLKDVAPLPGRGVRSEEHTSELQSLMRTSYAVFCLKKKKRRHTELENT